MFDKTCLLTRHIYIFNKTKSVNKKISRILQLWTCLSASYEMLARWLLTLDLKGANCQHFSGLGPYKHQNNSFAKVS